MDIGQMNKLDGFKKFTGTIDNPLRSATEFATQNLREAILQGALPQGAALRQEELAQSLSVSRMPVREALRILEAEGLVTFRSHHGFTVTEFNADQIIEIAEIRYSLESLALRKAVHAHTAESLRTLSDLLFELNTAETPERRDIRPARHRQFHLSLYHPCAMERLLTLIEHNLTLSERFSRIGSSQFVNVVTRDIDEHAQLLSAVQKRDEKRALSVLHNHIVGQAHEIVQCLANKSASKITAPQAG